MTAAGRNTRGAKMQQDERDIQNLQLTMTDMQARLRNIEQERLKNIEASQATILIKMDNFAFVSKRDYDEDKKDFVRKADLDQTKRLLYILITSLVGLFIYMIQRNGGV